MDYISFRLSKPEWVCNHAIVSPDAVCDGLWPVTYPFTTGSTPPFSAIRFLMREVCVTNHEYSLCSARKLLQNKPSTYFWVDDQMLRSHPYTTSMSTRAASKASNVSPGAWECKNSVNFSGLLLKVIIDETRKWTLVSSRPWLFELEVTSVLRLSIVQVPTMGENRDGQKDFFCAYKRESFPLEKRLGHKCLSNSVVLSPSAEVLSVYASCLRLTRAHVLLQSDIRSLGLLCTAWTP